MPFDHGNLEAEKGKTNLSAERRIYVCEDGSVRVEEKHYRRTFSPEEFVVFLRKVFQQRIAPLSAGKYYQIQR